MPGYRTGIPYGQVNLHTHVGSNGMEEPSTLSEFGSEQLEMIALSLLTGNATFAERVEHVIEFIRRASPDRVRGRSPILHQCAVLQTVRAASAPENHYWYGSGGGVVSKFLGSAM